MNYSQTLATLKIKINENKYIDLTIFPLDDLFGSKVHSKRTRKLITLDGSKEIEVQVRQYPERENNTKSKTSEINYDSRTKYITIQNDDMVRYKNYSKNEIQETLGNKILKLNGCTGNSIASQSTINRWVHWFNNMINEICKYLTLKSPRPIKNLIRKINIAKALLAALKDVSENFLDIILSIFNNLNNIAIKINKIEVSSQQREPIKAFKLNITNGFYVNSS